MNGLRWEISGDGGRVEDGGTEYTEYFYIGMIFFICLRYWSRSWLSYHSFFSHGEKKKCLVRWVLFAILATERLVLSFSIILREIIIIENDLKISRSLMEVCFVIHHNYSLVCKHNKSDTQKIGSIFCPTYYKWITRSSYRRDTVSMSQVLKDFDNILRSANMTGQLPRDRK